MNVPLYSGEAWKERSKQQAANLGLVFDKCFAGWNPDYTALASDSAKHEWVKFITNASKGPSKPALVEAIERQCTLVKALGGRTWRARATSRFVTGTGIANPLENGFVFHHTLGVPYLPATGLKGALRAYWEQWHMPGLPAERQADEQQRIDRLLGEKGVGSLVFLDMLPTTPPQLVPEVMTPHYGKWYAASEAEIADNAPGDWMSPTPIPFLAVEADAEFQMAVAPRQVGDPAWEGDLRHLEGLLKDTLDITGLGAKTAVGYGRFKLRRGGEAEPGTRTAAQKAITTASGDPKASTRAKGGGPPFAAGETLRAGTRLSWGEVGNVELIRPVTLGPGIKLPVRFVDDTDMEDDLPIGEIAELRHIR